VLYVFAIFWCCVVEMCGAVVIGVESPEVNEEIWLKRCVHIACNIRTIPSTSTSIYDSGREGFVIPPDFFLVRKEELAYGLHFPVID